MKAVLIVLDSVGIGEAPDAVDYDDAGCATLQHTAEATGGLTLPTLQAMGLGNIPGLLPQGTPIQGVTPVDQPFASFGAMQEVSEGKDTITGHWEICGLDIRPGFPIFPGEYPSFPSELTRAFIAETGRNIIGNKAVSGTVIIEELGPEHMETGSWIVYTSGDSVFQIAAHLDVVPLEELYKACDTARTLCDPYRTGRIIARPFEGNPGSFKRTKARKDFAFKPDEPLITERLIKQGIPVYAVGKIEDIIAYRGITESEHTGTTETSQAQTLKYYREKEKGLIFANFIDFDMLYGHRRDPEGYARALEQTDEYLAGFIKEMKEGDILIVTADHGNDPTFKGTDHTREYVPLLVYQPGKNGQSLGIRNGFYDIAQSLADFFGLDSNPRGVGFLAV